MRLSHQLISVSLIGILSACGGGGGGSKPPVTQSSVAAISSSAPSSMASSSNAVTSSSVSSTATSSSLSSQVSCLVTGSSSSSSVATSASSSILNASITSLIVVDQFGYLPDAQKIAVLRDPQTGYDSAKAYTPSASLNLVNAATGETVLSAAPVVWNSGSTDTSSGDKAWWFDFSSVTTPGTYAVVDTAQNLRSPSFKIATDVYKPVLKEAFRTFYYQRAGLAKQQPCAGAAWVDGASHIGAGQDTQARIYSDKNNAATEKDLSGGWYDAGDYNKYTTWAADYVIILLHAYIENPAAWGDDFDIPGSGNGIPDILDEVKWGVDWLKKMQDATGNNSVLSIVGLSHNIGSSDGPIASPPSSATERSYYGTASTNATMSTAAAFAFASKVFTDQNNAILTPYANDSKARAEAAWTWALANPNVLFYNNNDSKQPGSKDLGAGQQEPTVWKQENNVWVEVPDTKARANKKRIAAVYLYASNAGATYKNYVETDYNNSDLKIYVDNFHELENTALLYYANLSGVNTGVATDIKDKFKTGMLGGTDNWAAMTNKSDPYLAFLGAYTWGSNNSKSAKGSMFTDIIEYGVSGFDNTNAKNHALTYVNYIHGVNPQGMVYLSNMYSLGVHSSVNEFYHTWFGDGSPNWDRVGTSVYGPAPGFLVGGPNPEYTWDTNRCGPVTGTSSDPLCKSTILTPPYGQPVQKSYRDFNTSWPINSWSVTENSNGYQSNYLRLLSKFVN